MTAEEAVIDAIFNPRDPTVPHSIAEALRRGLVPREYLKECHKLLASYPYPRKPQTTLPARSEYNNPSWDNAVRALEDR